MSEKHNPLDLGEDYRKVLNRHGYAFQYSVLRFAERLHEQGRSPWIFEAAEFPVSLRDMHTRIDFILRKENSRLYIIAECKRANPAFSNWCFARAPYVRRNPNPEKVLIQSAWVAAPDTSLIEVKPIDPTRRILTSVTSERSSRIYHVGLDVKSNQPGDKKGKGTGAIEEAAGQVCKGVNGMVEFLSSQLRILPEGTKLWFVPVIFTTARIWTTEADLASANIERGEFESGAVAVQEMPWIWYQYHLSPALKHTIEAEETPFSIGEILETEFARSIAIVSVKGIEEFLLQYWQLF